MEKALISKYKDETKGIRHRHLFCPEKKPFRGVVMVVVAEVGWHGGQGDRSRDRGKLHRRCSKRMLLSSHTCRIGSSSGYVRVCVKL
ncbi:hypothetical protein QVD17_39476 [Tagetes erecta]|uniref:Uncharacterized protein n=1 Tax=Tagetes erecta TaxID=13708 RepID=A0AAD8JQU4_TARER|nr:hypothetical protein QVD17_39476 [Tagetes erecta]